MMKRLIVIFVSILCMQFVVYAQVSKTVTVTPGNLSNTLSSNEKKTITNLKVVGTIDARDFRIMRDSIPLLTDLDLNEVSVVGYWGSEGTFGTGPYEINYPENAVPNMAFEGNKKLSKIVLPSTLKIIDDEAFTYCEGLTNITIPPTVTSIGGSAFLLCRKLTLITIPSSVVSISGDAFLWSGLSSIVIPASVKTIGKGSFQGTIIEIIVDVNNPYFSSVDGVLFNKDKTTILQCTNFQKGHYSIPSTVTSVASYAFQFNNGLTSIYVPSSVNSIGERAFYGCCSISCITIPAAINQFGDAVIDWCIDLKSIQLLGDDPVDQNSSSRILTQVDRANCTLYVPAGSLSKYKTSNSWNGFTHIIEENGFWLSSDTITLPATLNATASFELNRKAPCIIKSDQNWVVIKTESTCAIEYLQIIAEENTSGVEREANIKVTTEDGKITKTILVKQSPANITHTSNISTTNITVFPNPVKTHFNIYLRDNFDCNGCYVKVTSLTGQDVLYIPILQQVSQIDIPPHFGKGIYVIKVLDGFGNDLETKKIIIR